MICDTVLVRVWDSTALTTYVGGTWVSTSFNTVHCVGKRVKTLAVFTAASDGYKERLRVLTKL